MSQIKLPRLPDRTPIKHTIVIMPEFEQMLRDYANLYHQRYGEVETIEALIPYIVRAFLESDRDFLKFRRNKENGDTASRLRFQVAKVD